MKVAECLFVIMTAFIFMGGISFADVELDWLETESPRSFSGTTFGIPWPQGTHEAGQDFELQTASGSSLPMQTWPTAFWPDGSLKWTAHAVASESAVDGGLVLKTGKSAEVEQPVSVSDVENVVTVDTGVIRCRIPRVGANFIDSVETGGQIVMRDGKLVCLLRSSPDMPERGGVEQTHFESTIEEVTVEQTGPVRAVVKITGMHRSGSAEREWMPFSLRLYFYAGKENIRIVHSIIYDGNEYEDFVSGVGVRFAVPVEDELHNRHIRFTGQDDGVWGEAVRGITGLRRDPGEQVRQAQIAGKATPPLEEWDERVSSRIDMIPTWSGFKLSQLSPDGFEISKRTEPGRPWIRSTAGNRALGTGYVGGARHGGVLFGLRHFWQSYPSQLEINGAASDEAEVTMWLWPPEAQPMDLRFYHDGLGLETHEEELEALNITYEDYQEGWGTPHGIARTSELNLAAVASTPTSEEIADFAASVETPPLLMAPPEHLLEAKVFGALWTLPDTSTPLKAKIEAQLDFLFDYYQEQVEQHRWYGFWDYGDVMHTYDPDRHVWRYDIGGYAWANSELSPDLWLWYSFLRSGRADIFRMAEAMTRHTGEVDVYHLGPFAGFGTRHNVQHWGDSSKQPRVSNAAYRRIYYYLTADERVGDLLHDLVDSDQTLLKVDILRKIRTAEEPRPDPAFMGFGTDWSSFAAAWLTEWERTGDEKWKERLVTGMKGIADMKYGWLAGGAPYNPATGEFVQKVDTVGVSHLSAVFGAVEINAELLQLLDVPEYEKAWLQYCRLYNASPEEKRQELDTTFRDFLREAHSRLTAYAAWKLDDEELAKRAWREFLSGDHGLGILEDLRTTTVRPPAVLRPVDEVPRVSTNAVSQWGLAAIQNLKLVGEEMPARADSLEQSP